MRAGPGFWDRRRAGVKAEAQALAVEPVEVMEEAPQTDAEVLEVLEALGLPDPDSMGAGDDFTAFMVKAVPQHLRNRALRKLWRSNPVLACVDGLNDYDDDYLTGSTGNGPIKTAYQVGKGMLYHVERMARLKEMAEEVPEEVPMAVEEEVVAAVEPEPVPDAAPEETNDEMSPAPRRMVFTFEEGTA